MVRSHRSSSSEIPRDVTRCLKYKWENKNHIKEDIEKINNENGSFGTAFRSELLLFLQIVTTSVFT